MEVGTHSDPDYPLSGTIDYVELRTDANKATFNLRAVLPNKDRALVPGMFVRLRVPLEQIRDAVLLPLSSIGTDQRGHYVLVAADGGKVERRSVTLLD
ncbi:hypothetical protein [Breoghania sp.]|uniref:efflux RND transporter periplasmic adaptor subunit n=1 Tax=Breoghania sp. TaxID=2065378 RepID=UPI00261AB940|nr:hypothetical protein [Breoghania sp.]MDJ0931002.1 hypothetical protein [Breoghania sp.]